MAKPILLYGMRPHLHSRGKSFRVETDRCEEHERGRICMTSHNMIVFAGEVLLKAAFVGFQLATFLLVRRAHRRASESGVVSDGPIGTTPKHNPRNPDPTADVSWGQQTDQEMFNTLFNYEILETERIPDCRPAKEESNDYASISLRLSCGCFAMRIETLCGRAAVRQKTPSDELCRRCEGDGRISGEPTSAQIRLRGSSISPGRNGAPR